MKTITKIAAAIILLAVFYFIVADGMMTVFGLSRAVQYAFNMGAIFIVCPACTFYVIGMHEEEKS